MTKIIGRARVIGLYVARLRPVVCLLALFLSVPAHSTEQRQIGSFAGLYHTAWTLRDGVPANITDLAQTTDGYLWLATQGGGLYRFDGVRFEQFQPRTGAALISDIVTALLAQPDGGLWIGYLNGGASLLKDGTLKNFATDEGLGPRVVSMFARDPGGSIWAATALGLKRFDGSRWEHVGADWNYPASYAERVYVDREGTLWVSSGTTLVYLRKGEKRFHSSGLHFSDLVALSQAQDSTLWTSGIKGLVIPFLVRPQDPLLRGSPFPLRAIAISVDRDGMLWVPTTSNGVWRFRAPRFSSAYSPEKIISNENHFAQTDGLTSDEGIQVLEDAEDDVWVATSGGLDRFRHAKLNTVALPSGARGIVLAPADHAGIFVSTGAVSPGILRLTSNQIEPVKGAPAFLSCAYRDREGTIWFGGINALWKFSKNRFDRVPLPANIPSFREVQAITEGPAGELWVAITLGDMFRVVNGKWSKFGGVSGLPRSTPLVAYTDSLGRVWFGYEQNTIAMLQGGHVKTLSSIQGVNVGNVTAISEKMGEIWIGGTSGVQRFDGARFLTLTAANGDFKAISGIVERSNGELWLNQMSGVVRIAREEISRFKQNPHYQVRLDLFNALDGMPGSPYPTSRLPSAVESLDGRLWFSTSSGIAWIDPQNMRANHVVPTVLVDSVKADDRIFRGVDRLSLPSRVQNLVVSYTALSLSIPERVRFRYMLEGFDKDWQQAGTRRQAFYSQLPPGDYRFRVTACNDDGLWNMAGVTYGFSIAPAYYQTNWFRALSIIAALFTVGAMYQLRLRQLARQLQFRYEERLAERTRIARDLHDTLLQSFHGLILRFQAVRNLLPERPEQAVAALDTAISRAADAITEGRDAVQELRGIQIGSNDLVKTLTSMGRELEADNTDVEGSGNPTTFRVLVEGTPRDIHAPVQESLYRIAREAVSNAFRHARANQIEVDIRYSRQMLRLRVRDDGIGLDSKLFYRGRRTGHWGLPGMRERTSSIGGHFELWSEINRGTEIQVTIPGAIAYKASEQAAAYIKVAEEGKK